ncbi:MAG TPA: hypothetical protein VFW77_02255 [Candidatus Saccharimonadales bacterium]|nr:hypothetical protein [Candidatus Saccharimonadales bacterium]
MKKILLISLIAGLLLGTFQIFIVRKDSRKLPNSNIDCSLAFSADCGISRITSQRGFPLSVDGESYPTALNSQYIINFFIFTLGVPLVALVGYKLVSKSTIKNK